MSINQRVALVTGGGTGLGQAVSFLLAEAGIAVVVNYSKSKEEAEETVSKIVASGQKAISVQGDVASPEDVHHMVSTIIHHYGRLDILIANAGTTVFHPFEELDAISVDDWDHIMDVNVKGVWLTARAAAPYLREHGCGRIVITTSVAGLRPVGSSLPYSVSKAAAIHLTKGLAKALAPDILVNAIAPGLLDTRWTRGHSQSTIRLNIEGSPLGRIPSVEDCAAQVKALVETNSMTGAVVVIDTGVSM